jgi:hypothetical protein
MEAAAPEQESFLNDPIDEQAVVISLFGERESFLRSKDRRAWYRQPVLCKAENG